MRTIISRVLLVCGTASLLAVPPVRAGDMNADAPTLVMPVNPHAMHDMHGDDDTDTHPMGNLPSSDGAAPGTYKDYGVTVHMPGDPLLAKIQLDQLEAVHHGDGSNGQAWDGRFRLGRDLNALWLRSEGERNDGSVEAGDVEAFWGHAIAPYWDLLAGVRHDLGSGPARNWAAVGVQGIAPYDFELEATLYVGTEGRSAVRLKASQDWLFTQNLILTPEIDVNAYGRSDPQRDIGAGVSDVSLGLRLRYEITRKFAPYIGLNWVRTMGATADYTHRNGHSPLDRQLVAGVRFWL